MSSCIACSISVKFRLIRSIPPPISSELTAGAPANSRAASQLSLQGLDAVAESRALGALPESAAVAAAALALPDRTAAAAVD
ncbi:hypothetical protein SKAU_G00064060 [Synaphobranchus kaupii]|uniref:Uncharacterized protein n=1 Tax=Synaphobranchus kaupii TaxID=118154 RepID=A0A9Q1J9W1_SYNKA|nr:hypothetical protein SKAU_G00064060 [Synaphobranchus kaupii]